MAVLEPLAVRPLFAAAGEPRISLSLPFPTVRAPARGGRCMEKTEEALAYPEKFNLAVATERQRELREMFAAAALQGLLTHPESDHLDVDEMAEEAWKLADAMMVRS